MSLATLVKGLRIRTVGLVSVHVRHYAVSGKPIPSQDQDQIHEFEDQKEEEDTVDKMRNKSRLGPRAYGKMHKLAPQLTDDEKQVYSLWRLRKLYGNYGSASDVNVGLLWPSKQEMELQKEKERVTYPDDIYRMIEIDKLQRKEEEVKIQKRQQELALKVTKLEDWKREVRERYQNKLRLAQEAKAKKEKVIEEIRQMFGYRIDPKDDKFKEALEKKEQEEKKAAKAAKKLKKQQKLIAEIHKMAGEGNARIEGDNTNSKEGGVETAPSTHSFSETKS
ncbi:large ribosomal subunit protein mL64-like isoform X1 [Macrobrachium nipponense]|uniref:large ribosomal subunit protein mL64-like isoform X1 n=1 Tax=Macrobrachium nipponense TaxID=159736 RepID=UPI0030C7BFB4